MLHAILGLLKFSIKLLSQPNFSYNFWFVFINTNSPVIVIWFEVSCFARSK